MYDGQPVEWQQFLQDSQFTQQDKEDKELYFGGLESIGFGRTKVFVTSHPSNPAQNS
jgi:CRISPR-associated protein Cmr4